MKPPRALVFDLLTVPNAGGSYRIQSEDVLRFHQSKAKVRITHAPARCSKSLSGAAELLYEAIPEFSDQKKPGEPRRPLQSKMIWAIGPDYPTNEEFKYLYKWIVEDGLWQLFGKKLVRAANNPNQGSMHIVVETGRSPTGELCTTTIEGKSSKTEKALQGVHVDAACMSEAAEHPAHIYEKYLMTRVGKLLCPTTPKPHAAWLRDLMDRGETNHRLGIEGIHYRNQWDPDRGLCVSANPFYDWDNFEQQMLRSASKRMDIRDKEPDWEVYHAARQDPYFAEQFLGEWVFYTGRVLPFRWQAGSGAWSHVLEELPLSTAKAKKFLSVDYGYSDGAVCLFWAVLHDGTLIIWDEIYERNLHTAAFADAILAKLEAHDCKPSYIVGDPSRPEVAALLRESGLRIWTQGSKNVLRDRRAGGLRLVRAMEDDPQKGRPMLFLYGPRCPKTIEEWKVLRRKEDYSGDEWAAAAFDHCDDHAFDAARVGIMTRPRPYEAETKRDWLAELEAENRVMARYTSTPLSPFIGPAPRTVREVQAPWR